ncbi:MAG: hypothetical protein O2921_00145 [Chloroflexi bacterium]|jgi:hypothetical protein|nr:hypothetical protein [Chloroflexota bacterium]MDA1281031.1 hypothetical protein [Chloroflexota bacterium]
MTKVFSLLMVLALVGVITAVSTVAASAKGKDRQAINLQAALAVTGFEDITSVPSGLTTIDGESLTGLGDVFVIEGPVELQGMSISAEQGSHELFTSPDFSQTRVRAGESAGTFVMNGDAGQVRGDYHLSVSTSDECQILGRGTWVSKAKDSILAGNGDINVCTNYMEIAPGITTFVAQVFVTGSAVLVD